MLILHSPVTIALQVSRKFSGASKHASAVINVMVESCALYTLFALALLIAFERASDADWVLLDMITPLVVSVRSVLMS